MAAIAAYEHELLTYAEERLADLGQLADYAERYDSTATFLGDIALMAGLAAEHGEKKTVMIDATYLKAHRTATSLGVKKGGVGA